MRLVIPGEPIPQARPRFTKTGIAYTTDKCRNYRQYIGKIVKEYMKKHNLEPAEEALVVSVWIYRGIPQSWSKSKKKKALTGEIVPTSKPDIDNFVKSALDGVTHGGLWKDDCQVVRVVAEKIYSDNPRLEIVVEPMF